ncbi:MAG: hypothetical protein Q4A68_10665 [Anaerobiospirillum succiniciproducens]|uniref:hypothetical protein n=1 Tax=Anaerobiospirillum succiniciproducens TaxID=13335 RepID=UPI0026DAC4ED|nr:hypothetical protein [Anaerobiospirillum succiniciproducens]MDO4676994.1 hypothetical protein [Anaerobiospirillum succiniciproducens]
MIEKAITRNGIYRFGIKSLTMYFVISMFSIYKITSRSFILNSLVTAATHLMPARCLLPAATALAIFPL